MEHQTDPRSDGGTSGFERCEVHMALSEQEQRLLDEMERHLYQNDADVVSTAGRSSGGVSTRSVVLAVLAVAVGLGIVLGGLALQQPVVGVIGFVAMLIGVVFAFRPRKGDAQAQAESAPDPKSSGAPKAKGSFMGNLEERWERRQSGDE